MTVTSLLDASFTSALSSHGFVRLSGEPCSYVLRRLDPPSDLHVDVHVFTDPPHFSVVLQDVGFSSQRRELLEEFEGIRRYAFKPDDPSSISLARDMAIEHLHRYGLPWLFGHSVSTTTLRERGALAAQDRYRRLISDARTQFHAGERVQARRLLEEAEGIAPLDPASAKMLTILRT